MEHDPDTQYLEPRNASQAVHREHGAVGRLDTIRVKGHPGGWGAFLRGFTAMLLVLCYIGHSGAQWGMVLKVQRSPPSARTKYTFLPHMGMPSGRISQSDPIVQLQW